MPTPAAAAPAVRAAAPDLGELARQTSGWLAAAAPGTYVIQLASAKDAAAAAVLLQGLAPDVPRPVRVLHGLSRGSPAWMILAGEFPDREAALAAVAGCKIGIVDALRYAPHPTHAHLDRALQWIAAADVERAVLTHLHVDMDYNTLSAIVPANVEVGFDGWSWMTG